MRTLMRSSGTAMIAILTVFLFLSWLSSWHDHPFVMEDASPSYLDE